MTQCDFSFPVNKGDLEKGAHLEGQLWFGDLLPSFPLHLVLRNVGVIFEVAVESLRIYLAVNDLRLVTHVQVTGDQSGYALTLRLFVDR